uniref:Cyclin n=1 Tax=Lotharella globosa TaxID=91324 RepID=A0A6U3CVW3_9EUKA|mmetsp:Transcript_12061/g.24237  ORF Transcript_12061/g.24237 Transcript_12061/m.24237 type:complete len:223 (-) Transcript_12061:454-1122(-)
MDTRPDKTGKAIVPVLACVLNQLCARNDQLSLDPKYVSKFHALRPPGITIRDYLERIAKYAACSGECFVLALVYIDRIIQSNPNFVVNSLNIHRLLITSVMISAKFFDDQYFNNAYYAKVGGVPCKEMNSLEVEFLFLTNFSLFVTYDTYKQYHTELRNHAKHSSCACNPHRVPKLEGEKDVSAADEEKSKDVIMMQTESVPRPNENHSQQQGTAMMASTPY